ncbi:hypothetical protein JB92DRAFT_2912628 [Gautieria morchelliformis]|nr:hypothetical protein JB92DRAFT_2912628 [Gautieria morchelliformis]
MDCGGFSGAMLDWKCPNRAHGSDIPLDVYLDIFAWLKPAADPDTDRDFYNMTLARLAPVCRYFAHYATHELWRCPRFFGAHYRNPNPADAWCTGVKTQLQPVETLRTHVRECTLSNWIDFLQAVLRPKFTTQIIPMLSRLDNLAVLTLDDLPLSRALLQSIGRLQTLEELTFRFIIVDNSPENWTNEPVFVAQETPFPALRRFVFYCTDHMTDEMLRGVLCIAGAPSLRTLIVQSGWWLHLFLPFINPELVSLCGDLTFVPPEAFLRFLKGHAALQNLTVYYTTLRSKRSYLGIELDPADLPELRSFGGPFALAPKFIGSRPVTKLASPRNMRIMFPFKREWRVSHLSNMFSHPRNAVHNELEVWRALIPIGRRMSQLFISVYDASEAILSQIGLCFPNLVHLQLDLSHMGWDDLSRWNVGPALFHLKSLKTLALSSENQAHATYWILAGEQHHFVHDIYQGSCPTLKTVIFGPLMMWHLRALPTRAEECHCELELLSPRTIRMKLQRLDTGQQVCDWKGRLARLLREGPSGLSELEIGRIIKPGPDP